MQRCGTAEQISIWQEQDAEDYRFYAKALRTLYNKPKLKRRMIERMKEVEERKYFKVPPAK